MKLFVITVMLLGLSSITSCKKFLDEKANKKINTPSTLADLEGILNNYGVLNARYPSAAEIGSDNYYLTDAGWAATSELHQNLYYWQKYDNIGGDWNATYTNIYYTNVILEALSHVEYKPSEEKRFLQVKGSALFIRSYYFYALAQLFAPPYNENTADADLGIPLKINTDYNETSVRSSVKQTYERIINDLTKAVPWLPDNPASKYWPSKPAAYAALARTYMVMRNYNKAGLYADSCLQLYDSLINYNSVSASASIPFTQFNKEVIYDCRTASPSALSQSRAKVDSLLYNSYATNDLRRTIFFKSNSDGSHAFKGNYTGLSTAGMFTGISTDEMYLLRAECYARAGDKDAAIADLNTLLSKRWKTGTFIALSVPDAATALQLVLAERRKELPFRTIRWSDLRRLNMESSFATTLTRTLNGQTYTLMPGDIRYVLQIDRDAINKSGMQQNP
jgi:hypothetical protein